MNVRLLNWQHVYKIKPYRNDFAAIVERVLQTSDPLMELEREGVKLEVNVIFAGPSQIRKLNRDTRSMDATTDVLSFPMHEFRNGQPLRPFYDYDFEWTAQGKRIFLLGDVVICPKRAAEQAEMIGQDLTAELSYLLLHGLFHLLGYDHIDAVDARLMRAMEKSIIEDKEDSDD